MYGLSHCNEIHTIIINKIIQNTLAIAYFSKYGTKGNIIVFSEAAIIF
jgi:hypothetical protein